MAAGWGKDDVVPSEELFEIINERARAAGMDEAGAGRQRPPARVGARALLRVPERAGHGGLHQPLSRHFCSECNRLRLTADGKLRPCLFSDDEYDVRTALRAETTRRCAPCSPRLWGRSRRAPRQSRHRTRHVANRRLRGSACLRQAEPADAARGASPRRGRRDEACRLRAIPRARVPKYASPLRSPEFDAPRPFSLAYYANLRPSNLQDTEPRRHP